MIEIISKRIKIQYHNHLCPICRKVRWEPNEVCGKVSGDHKFACVLCLQDHRLRFGSDLLLDVYLDQMQLQRFQQMAPDRKSADLDQRDIDRALKQQAEAVKLTQDLPPAEERHSFPIAGDSPEKAKEKMDQLMEEADKITEEEAREEIKKLEEGEKL